MDFMLMEEEEEASAGAASSYCSEEEEEEEEDIRHNRRAKRSRHTKRGAAVAGQGEAHDDGHGEDHLPSPSESGGVSACFHTKYVPWTKEEDLNLRQLVDRLGPKNWSNIASHMQFRTSKSCRLRWLNQLRPNVQTGSFTPEEDQVIIQTQAQIGNRWTAIAAMLPGRTDNAVKNRWNSALRKRVENVVHPQQQQQQQQQESRTHKHHDRQQQQQQKHQDSLKQQQAIMTQLLAAGAGSAPPGMMHGAGASLHMQHLFGMGMPQTGQSLGSLLPAPPPSSTSLVATAPPFQLPMPLMTLQPQMNASEAAAALAAANCDVLKKVPEMSANVRSATSTAMVSKTLPPAVMPAAQHAGWQQHSMQSLAMQQLMTSQFAAKLLQQQQSSAPPPSTMAMVASTPPPMVMAMPAGSQPAVSWQLPPASQQLFSSGGQGQARVKVEADVMAEAVSGAGKGYSSGLQQQQQQQQQQQLAPDLAQLLLMQQQQLQQQQVIMQQLALQLQSGSAQPQPSSLPAPASVQQEQQPAGMLSNSAASFMPDLLSRLMPSLASSGSRPGEGGLAAMLEAAAGGGGIGSALSALVASGGNEALQHLLTLGMGTLMTAAALRQQGHGANTLAMAQLQTASHPSAQALLALLADGQHAGGTAPDAAGQLSITAQQQQQQQHDRQMTMTAKRPSMGNGFMGSPLGSMSDLVSMFDQAGQGYGDPMRTSGSACFGGSPRHGSAEALGHHLDQGLEHADAPGLRHLLGSDPSLRYMQPGAHGSSSPLMGLLDDGDIALAMH